MKRFMWLITMIATIAVLLYFTRVLRDIPAIQEQSSRPPETEATVMVEGVPVEVDYAEHRAEFSMYVDEDCYEVTEEEGVTYIRAIGVLPSKEAIREENPLNFEGLSPEEDEKELRRLVDQYLAFYYSLPHCEMEIRHLPDVSSADAAEQLHAQMLQTWESVSEIEYCEEPAGLCFFASQGLKWDSKQEDVYFIRDGQQGTFQIILRYFLEAAEGHGIRFREMLKTFEVVSKQFE